MEAPDERVMGVKPARVGGGEVHPVDGDVVGDIVALDEPVGMLLLRNSIHHAPP